ncbi:MAG: hypothetical protein Q8M95_00605 [Candidatus Methanoperedens sp.]|nr:hypothetical protein [Candidatus Methanoperedens sp.]
MDYPIYIMVTDFEGYWDHTPNEVSYSVFMIPGKGKQPEKIIENTQTIFIKINRQTKKVEKAWKGFVNNFNSRDGKIYFKVNIDKDVTPIPLEYSKYKIGWHISESELEPRPVGVFPAFIGLMSIDPPFFDKLKTTNDWNEFEDLTFLLLKLLGIHDIYKYESKEQAGKADGFFIFKRLAVLYDCTLTRDFKERKKQQIENFVNKLNTGKLEYQGGEKTLSIHYKQVWIITRGSSQEIMTVNDIIVKEVSIDKIIQTYRNRLENNIDETALENKLRYI